MKRKALGLAASLILICSTNAVFAQGKVENGRELAYTCSGCHGVVAYKNAYPFYHVPRIAGQNYEYLVAALKAYRNEERPHPTMRAQAKSYTLEEINDLAAYLASLKKEAK